MPCTLGPYAILSYMLIGNGFGCWKTMPTFLRSTVVSTDGAYIFSPSISMLPSILTLSTRSFILLIHFKNVDLPHPDGPISAVTLFSFMSIIQIQVANLNFDFFLHLYLLQHVINFLSSRIHYMDAL